MFRVSKIDDGGRAFQGHETHASEPKLKKKVRPYNGRVLASTYRILIVVGAKKWPLFFPRVRTGGNFFWKPRRDQNDASDAPNVNDASDDFYAPHAPDAHDAPDTLDGFDAPDALDAPDAPDAPRVPRCL